MKIEIKELKEIVLELSRQISSLTSKVDLQTERIASFEERLSENDIKFYFMIICYIIFILFFVIPSVWRCFVDVLKNIKNKLKRE